MNLNSLVAFIKWIFKNTAGQPSPYIFSPEDWYALYSIAMEHKVDAIIYRLMCNYEGLLQTIPPPIRRAFRAIYLYNYHQNNLGIKEANIIAQTCLSAGISLCAERGIALLMDLYPDVGMRPIQDIDFLASIEDCSSIHNQLTYLGYEISMINNQPITNISSELTVNSILYKKVGIFQEHERRLTIDITYCMKDVDLQNVIAKSVPTHCAAWKILQYEDFFLLLCHGIYEDALEHRSTPKPEHCSIGKLIDLVGYSQIHPILLTEQKQKMTAVRFAQSCANTFFGINLFN